MNSTVKSPIAKSCTNDVINILIVEDEQMVTEYLKELLCGADQRGFCCYEAEGLAEAMASLAKRAVDVVLLDLGLPDSSGIETALAVRKVHPEIPIVVLTGMNDEDIAVEALRLDIQDYLIKGQISGSLLMRSIRYAIERKRVLNALRQSEENYRGLFDTMTEAFAQCEIVLDAGGRPSDFRFLNVNKAWERFTGISAEHANGRTALELVPDLDRSIIEICGKVAMSGEPVLFEQNNKRLDKWFEMYVYSPEQGFFASFSRDITAHKKAEEALRESEERLRLAAQAATFGTYDIDIQAEEVFWSPELRSLYGLPREGESRVPLNMGLKFVHPDDRERISRILSRSMASESEGRFREEHRIVRSDGTVLWVNMRGQIFFEGEGEQRRPVRITGVLLDITERKRAEEALRESEERYRALVHAASSTVWRVSADGNTLLELTGAVAREYKEPETQSGEWLSFVHPEDQQKTLSRWKRAVETKGLYENEQRSMHPDGTYHYHLSRGVPVLNSAGEVREWIGSSIDITERKMAEQAMRESEERFRVMADGAPVIIWVTDENGALQFVNRAYLKFFGSTFEEVEGGTWQPLLHPGDKAYWEEFLRAVREQKPFRAEARVRRADGEWRLIATHGEPRFSPNGAFLGHGGISSDITERKQAEQALRESEERFRTLADNIAQLAWMADEKGWVFWYNKRWFDYTGASQYQLRGRGWQKFMHPEHARRVTETSSRAYKTGEAWEDTFPLCGGDGGYRWFLCRALPIRNEQGRVVRWFGTNTDITERMQMEEEIKQMAQHDMLTGLPNRRLFSEIISVELAQARRNGSKVAVFFLDLDRFKEINDTLGHKTGDELLKETALRLKSVIRTSDTVARIGGDEFNVIIPDVYYPEYASEVAQKILNEIRRPFRISGRELSVSTSIGISVFPHDSEDVESLLRYADIAMYHAKEKGRNNYQFYNPVINTRSYERLKLENSLRQAIERGEFQLYFQPLVDVKTRKTVSAEVLLRWRHPEKGLLEPRQFFDAVEDIGLASELDEWVLKAVAGQIRTWMDDGFSPLCLTVNLSLKHFQSPELLPTISRLLQESKIPPACIDIEITESTAMGNINNTIARLRELSLMGVHVSLDHFGTGYSSLSHLKSLPIQKLKIDQSFIRDIASDPNDRAIITAVLLMAHSMKLKVAAAGVEGDSQFSFLSGLDCDEVQGFLFSEPLPAEKFREMVAAGR